MMHGVPSNSETNKIAPEMKHRYDALISLEFDLMNRLNSSIHALNSQNGVLLGFSFALLSLEIAIIFLILDNDMTLGTYSSFTFYSFLITMVASIIISLFNFFPRDYKEYELYRMDRYTKLIQANEIDLYNDVVYFYKEIYEFNFSKYMFRVNLHRIAFCIFSVSCLLAVITMLLIYMWGQ